MKIFIFKKIIAFERGDVSFHRQCFFKILLYNCHYFAYELIIYDFWFFLLYNIVCIIAEVSWRKITKVMKIIGSLFAIESKGISWPLIMKFKDWNPREMCVFKGCGTKKKQSWPNPTIFSFQSPSSFLSKSPAQASTLIINFWSNLACKDQTLHPHQNAAVSCLLPNDVASLLRLVLQSNARYDVLQSVRNERDVTKGSGI